MLPLKAFYFIRHGETDLNRQGLIMGSIDHPLNARGIQQAQEAAAILQDHSFDVIISSPRKRAHRTAEIIAESAKKPLLFESGLTERVWGEAEGKPFDLTKELSDDAHAPKGAEMFSAFQKRVLVSLSSLLLIHERPLIVSHGGVFKALAHSLGYTDKASSNGAISFFNPPQTQEDPWHVSFITERLTPESHKAPSLKRG